MTKNQIKQKIEELDNKIKICNDRLPLRTYNISLLILIIIADIINDILFFIFLITGDKAFIACLVIGFILLAIFPFSLVATIKSCRAADNIVSYMNEKEELEQELQKKELEGIYISNSTSNNEIIDLLYRSKQMLINGVITEEEFNKIKKNSIEKLKKKNIDNKPKKDEIDLLLDAKNMYAAGTISEEEYDNIEKELISRLSEKNK